MPRLCAIVHSYRLVALELTQKETLDRRQIDLLLAPFLKQVPA